MIRLEKICWDAGMFRLEEVSFEVPKGNYGVLMGKTGTGKTTLLEILCGLHQAQQGRVWIGDRDVTREEPGNRGLGYVPQDGALFPTMRVWEQIAFAQQWRRRGERRSKTAITDRVQEMAEEMGISHLLERHPQGLSGGEKQRVALARALAVEPQVLLLDEPLASVDEETQDDLITLLKKTQRERHITVLHVTHSRREAAALGEVRLRLENGRVMRELPLESSIP